MFNNAPLLKLLILRNESSPLCSTCHINSFYFLLFNFRLEAINGIEHIFKLSMITDEKLGSPYWEWLALVPLYHQLQSQTGGICVSQDTDPQNPNWFTIGIDEKKLKEFRNYAQSKRYMHSIHTV